MGKLLPRRPVSGPVLTNVLTALAFLGGLLWLVLARTRGRFYAASFATALALLLAWGCYAFAKSGTARLRVAALLGIYLALTVLFGAIHYSLFMSRPDLYSFADSIKEGKVVEEFDEAYAKVLARSKALYVLALAHASIDKALQASRERVFFANPDRAQIEGEKGFVTLEGSSRIRLRYEQLLIGKDLVHLHWVDVRADGFSFSMGGDALAASAIPSAGAAYKVEAAESSKEMQAALELLIDTMRAERSEGLREVRAQIEGRPDWNIIDFTYYSAVTITTLGYGDILPNATVTRLVVMLNSVAGVFFAAFALLVLWPSKDGAPA